MSKIIKITEQNLAEIRKEFEDALKGIKLSDGKLNFTKSFANVQRKAILYFTESAYLKMLTLVREFDKEVAWHGVAKRCEGEEDAYIISDILVYPQEVTGSTVNTDQEKYQTWLMSHDDDIFNNIRMQGHSHVNMTTSPSSVDTALYDRLLDQLDDTMFYIFLIWNKRGEKTIKIYDLMKNILFETADVTVEVRDDGVGMEKFLREAKEMVQDKKNNPAPVTYGGANSSYGTYGNTAGQSSYSNYCTPKSAGGVHTGEKKKKKKEQTTQTTGYWWNRHNGYSDEYDDPYSGYGYR